MKARLACAFLLATGALGAFEKIALVDGFDYAPVMDTETEKSLSLIPASPAFPAVKNFLIAKYIFPNISFNSLYGNFFELLKNRIHLSNFTFELTSFPVLNKIKPKSGIVELFNLNKGIFSFINSTLFELFILAIANNVETDKA